MIIAYGKKKNFTQRTADNDRKEPQRCGLFSSPTLREIKSGRLMF